MANTAVSKQATQQLEEAGFTAYNMKGGMNAWGKVRFQVKTGKVK
ncbi:MAG: rhodanese-like domain-containing protein [Chloroflexi bacterium]|nr:rhodanese-like domain-containing protein [Chloroflexota bacterium]